MSVNLITLAGSVSTSIRKGTRARDALIVRTLIVQSTDDGSFSVGPRSTSDLKKALVESTGVNPAGISRLVKSSADADLGALLAITITVSKGMPSAATIDALAAWAEAHSVATGAPSKPKPTAADATDDAPQATDTPADDSEPVVEADIPALLHEYLTTGTARQRAARRTLVADILAQTAEADLAA